jgi:hypothetical protein
MKVARGTCFGPAPEPVVVAKKGGLFAKKQAFVPQDDGRVHPF